MPGISEWLYTKRHKGPFTLTLGKGIQRQKTDDRLPFVSPPPSQAPKPNAPKPKHTKAQAHKSQLPSAELRRNSLFYLYFIEYF